MSAMSGSTPAGRSGRSEARLRSASRAALSLRLAMRACSRCRLLVVGRDRCAIKTLPGRAAGEEDVSVCRQNMILQKLAATLAGLLALTLAPARAGAPAAIVPFELINRHVVLGASVNGSAPLSFVLDTGDRVA